jgi:hypothetical protein
MVRWYILRSEGGPRRESERRPLLRLPVGQWGYMGSDTGHRRIALKGIHLSLASFVRTYSLNVVHGHINVFFHPV